MKRFAAVFLMSLLAGAVARVAPARAADSRQYEILSRQEIVFIPNHGQEDPAVKFMADFDGGRAFFTAHSVVLAGNGKPVTMEWPSRGAQTDLQAEAMQGGLYFSYIGNDSGKWREDLPVYGKLCYRNIVPGVDLVFYGKGNQLEHDFVVHPGADPRRILLRFVGDSISLKGNGDVQLESSGIVLRRPHAYCKSAIASSKDVSANFVLDGRYVSLVVGNYDPRADLVIDPVIQMSSPIGDEPFGISLDGQGNIIIIGLSGSQNFPLGSGKMHTRGIDAFLLKLRPNGDLIFGALLGGSRSDFATHLATDLRGNIYISGRTESPDFPVTAHAFDHKCGTDGRCNPYHGGRHDDIFVSKFSATGKLQYSTYLGGSNDDEPRGMGVDLAGEVYLAVRTIGSFPLVHPLFSSGRPGAVVKISQSGSQLLFSTYLGGCIFGGLALDVEGNVFVAGYTLTADLPVVRGFQNSLRGPDDAYIAELNPQGSAILFSTYLGGSQGEGVSGISVDLIGNVVVVGETGSNDFPLINPVQTVRRGKGDAFVTKFRTDGTGIQFSTYWGGSKDDSVVGVDFDPRGNIYIAGTTLSPNLRVKNAVQTKLNKGGTSSMPDAFLLKLDPSGTQVLYSTYFGGHSADGATAVKAGKNGATYVTGDTASNDFTYVRPFMAPAPGGFLLKINPSPQ